MNITERSGSTRICSSVVANPKSAGYVHEIVPLKTDHRNDDIDEVVPGHGANSQFGPSRPTADPSGQSMASAVHTVPLKELDTELGPLPLFTGAVQADRRRTPVTRRGREKFMVEVGKEEILQDTCEPQEQNDGNNADDNIADLLQLSIHRNIIENQCNDEKDDERCNGTHKKEEKKYNYTDGRRGWALRRYQTLT